MQGKGTEDTKAQLVSENIRAEWAQIKTSEGGGHEWKL